MKKKHMGIGCSRRDFLELRSHDGHSECTEAVELVHTEACDTILHV